MGLAPYGDPASGEKESYKKTILEKLVDIRHDGSILLNMENFEFATGLRMVNDKKWEKLFGISRRQPEGELRSFVHELGARGSGDHRGGGCSVGRDGPKVDEM